jgi:hypothetical protein
MATTYTLIASANGSGSSGTVTFSSIPQTYTDLFLTASIRDAFNADAYNNLYIRLNGSTTLDSTTVVLGSGSATVSTRINSTGVGLWAPKISTNQAPANTYASHEFYIPKYTGGDNKVVSMFGVAERDSTSVQLGGVAGLWRSTSAVTSITMYSPNNITTLSTFYLYGIKNS